MASDELKKRQKENNKRAPIIIYQQAGRRQIYHNRTGE